MGDTKDKEIIIKHISSGGLSGEALKGCYFMGQGNNYTFYDKDGNEKASKIKLGQPFSFVLDELKHVNWTLSITNPVGPDKLLGTWRNNIEPATADGSYQAEAGGSGEEGDADAASAAGYSS
jgi:hypothetical protein